MKKMKQEIIIFGTGEMAELALYYFTHDSDYKVVAFTCDDNYINADNFCNLPLIPYSMIAEKYPATKYKAHVALSYMKLNKNRKEKYFLMKDQGYQLVSYISTKSVSWPDLTHGDNCFILENQTIQPNVKIGDNVMIWSGNHLGHSCQIHNHAYLASHICLSGHTIIGDESFIGVNVAVKDFTKIGKRVFITMGANVVKDVLDDSVVLAAQSNVLSSEDPKAVKIINKFFRIFEE